MASDTEEKIIETLLYEVRDMSTELEDVGRLGEKALFEFIGEYNWDDGFQLPRAVADNPSCDLATALEMFWLSESFNWLECSEANQQDSEWYEFSKYLTAKILLGQYEVGANKFTGLNRFFSKVDLKLWRDRGLPDVLFRDIG